MSPKRAKGAAARDIATEQFQAGLGLLGQQPLFGPLLARATVVRRAGGCCPADGWAVVTTNGAIHAHPTRRGAPAEWLYVLAHCLLHLGFGHLAAARRPAHPREWATACDCVVARFLADLKLGQPPEGIYPPRPEEARLIARDEERLYREFCERGIPAWATALGTAGAADDLIFEAEERAWPGQRVDWPACFGEGLAQAVTYAVDLAGGRVPLPGSGWRALTAAQRARDWFIGSYPLLGALAASFEIVEDPLVCQRLSIGVAAVDAESEEIFINPAAGLDEYECRFVMAHELLHVGLCHHARRQGRDPWYWNVAVDFLVNGWLVEMGVGAMPSFGLLYDPELKGLSAEAIYDRIVTDLRRYRKLATLRGVGLGDMLERGAPDWWEVGPGVDLDAFYRRCLEQGLALHEAECRGYLPAGLVEEIRALSQPPVPWDVELAKWFDGYFAPLEQRRSYARPSRRQSASPDIPRPRWLPDAGAEDGRTFGVVLDTSGSMDRALLAKALGAIAGYALARDVPAVRVVFCDAATYDEGYLPPEAITDRVRVRGRGGTVLQPAIDLLERAEDFPRDGPLLIITDGYCDRLRVRREHAFLLPVGRHLPFVPKGKVFRIR